MIEEDMTDKCLRNVMYWIVSVFDRDRIYVCILYRLLVCLMGVV